MGPREIVHIRLIIARAAQNDSLGWWDDSSLTDSGAYVLDRLFASAPDLAGRKLALAAAEARHRQIFENRNEVLHLFRLDRSGEFELGADRVDLAELDLDEAAIESVDELRDRLSAAYPDKAKFQSSEPDAKGRVQIHMSNGEADLVDIASALAAAYASGEIGTAVFPYVTETN